MFLENACNIHVDVCAAMLCKEFKGRGKAAPAPKAARAVPKYATTQQSQQSRKPRPHAKANVFKGSDGDVYLRHYHIK